MDEQGFLMSGITTQKKSTMAKPIFFFGCPRALDMGVVALA